LANSLHTRFPKGYTPGKERCMRILLASQAARDFVETYSHVGNWKAVIELQRMLATAWETWPNEKEALNQMRKLILGEIATSPADPRPGCIFCPTRCWFGMIFQSRDQSLVSGLVNQLRTAKSNQRVNPGKLAKLIGVYPGLSIANDFLPYAAYCLYTQSTQDERALRVFRKEIGLKK
jgi:hypothetical protein